jgi:hypothetical protein
MKLNPGFFSRSLHVPIRNQILDKDEADRILKEVEQIDPKTLGPLKATGMKFWLRTSPGSHFDEEVVFPFLKGT